MNMIERAIQFAAEAHAGALRKGTELPYILHPLEAAAIAARFTKDPEVITAAVLHDVAEDTRFSTEDIAERFGRRVASLTDSCTENKRRDQPAAETWMIRKQETLEHLRTASREEKIVSFADKLSNLRSMMTDYFAEGEAFWNRFEMKDPRKHVWYYLSMIEPFEELDDSILYREYIRLCRMLRTRVEEYETLGAHDVNAMDVIATPRSGYWVLMEKKSESILLMTEEEMEGIIRANTEETGA